MSLIKEFKKFAMQGNVVALAIGIVIGGAFKDIISSMVNDIITPAILQPALKAAKLTELSQLVIPGTGIKYGNFISTVISFIIVAFTLFVVVQGINRVNKKLEEAPAPAPTEPSSTDKLLMEIRDSLKK